MSQHDTLVEWASEVGEGSWARWKAACESLRLNPTGAARNLSARGHVEFDWAADRFACAPTSGVLVPRSSGCIIITGARPRGLRQRLEALCADPDQSFDADLREPVPQREGAATWMVEIEMDDLDAFSIAAGLNFEIDAGRQILYAMPNATLETAAEPDAPDRRFPRVYLRPTDLSFEAGADPGTDGLWWVEEHRRDIAFIRHESSWFRVPNREHGPYLAYPDQPFLEYDLHPQMQTLRVRNRAPLPPLLARAATLQSGRLPLPDGPQHHAYANIDQEFAERISELLGSYIA
jgi:hypothetical protein